MEGEEEEARKTTWGEEVSRTELPDKGFVENRNPRRNASQIWCQGPLQRPPRVRQKSRQVKANQEGRKWKEKRKNKGKKRRKKRDKK